MTATIAPRVRTLVLLLLAAAGLLLAGAGPVSAHAVLTGSDPQQGSVVEQAPDRVQVTFSEEVALSDDSLRVLDPKGERVDTGEPSEVSGTTYAVRLRDSLADGTYTVSYQVVSADSHPVAGAYTFSVGAPSATSVSVSDQTAGGGVVGALYGFGRYVSYAGFVVLVGGAAFVLACWQRGSGVRAVQRLVVSGWLALTSATLALLLMRGSYTGSGKVADIFDLDLLGDVLQTKTGAALVSRLLLLAAAALFIAVLFGAYDKREGTEKRDLAFGLAIGGTVVAAGLAASWAMSEHASTGLQPGIAMPVDVVHLLAVAAWLGGLTALLVALYRSPELPPDGTAVRRFSALAFGSVLTLVVTGVYQSWRQLGSWSALTDTRYGQLLLVKVALVVLLVGVAWISRRWTGRLADPSAAKPRTEEATASATGGTDTDPAGETEGSASGNTEPADSKRAARLARQRAGGAVSGAAGQDSAGDDGQAAPDSTAPSRKSATATAPDDTDTAGEAEGPAPADSEGAARLARQRANSATATASDDADTDTDPANETEGSASAKSTIATASDDAIAELADEAEGSAPGGAEPADSARAAQLARQRAGSAVSGAAESDGAGDAVSDTGAQSRKTATTTAPGDTDTDPAGEAEDSTSGGAEPADSARAAQLARQRAAAEAARQKRVRDADPNRFGLRRSVLAEAGVAVVLLAVTTALTSTEPGRTEQEAAKAVAASSSDAGDSSGALTLDMPFDTGGEDGKGVVRVELDPARAGNNEMHVYVTRPNGRAFDVPEVKVAFTLEAQDIGPLPVVPDHITTGHWSANGVQVPMGGDWKIAVTVRTSDIDQATVSKNAKIG